MSIKHLVLGKPRDVRDPQLFHKISLVAFRAARFWWNKRHGPGGWIRASLVHGVALVLCIMILGIVVTEKFTEGGWKTLAVTAVLVGLCFLIRKHYRGVRDRLTNLSAILTDLPLSAKAGAAPFDLDAGRQMVVLPVRVSE